MSNSSILHQIGCILVYDQQCMLNNNSLNSLLEGAPSSSVQHNDDKMLITTCTTNIVVAINIDYFNTILNYTILILNIMMVVCLSNVVDWYATSNRMIEMQHRQHHEKEKRLQSTSITRSSIDIRRPSNLAMFVCFGFGRLHLY